MKPQAVEAMTLPGEEDKPEKISGVLVTYDVPDLGYTKHEINGQSVDPKTIKSPAKKAARLGTEFVHRRLLD